MTLSPLGASAIALAAALLAGLALTPASRWSARRLGLVYKPSIDRWGKRPTALLGGVAIAAAALVGWVVGVRMADVGVRGMLTAGPGLGVAAAAGMMFVVGLADDVVSMRPQVKFVLQLLAGVVLISLGAIANLTPWYVVNAVLTLLWFVAVTNAVNLLDNMDGVAAGVAGIAAFFLGLSFLQAGAVGAAVASWALAGAAFGFLAFNFHPASIFMGDAGSLFLGALLAGLVVAAPSVTSGSLVSVLFVPLAICGVPILDTALVAVTRTLAGRGIAQGGRDHSTHRLVALGLTEKQVAALLYAFAAAGGLVALSLTGLARDAAIIVGVVFLVVMALLAAYLGRMHVEHATESRGPRQVTLLVTRLLYKRRLAEILLDVVLVSVAWYAAFRLRFDGAPPAAYVDAFEATLAFVVAGQISLFALFGVYQGTWQYLGVTDLFRIAGAVVLGAILLFVAGELFVAPLSQSHSVVYIFALCAAALVMGSRASFRLLEQVRRTFVASGEPAIIYGAGQGGELALREMAANEDIELAPVCFLDDDARKHGRTIHGVPVIGGVEALALAAERYGATSIVVATAKLVPEVLETVQQFAGRAGLKLLELRVEIRSVEGVMEPAARLSLSRVPRLRHTVPGQRAAEASR